MKTMKLEKIFLVEDSPIERAMLKDHLGKYSKIDITEYSSGAACIKDLVLGSVEEPDLILMDYFLESSMGSSKDGLESLAKIKEIFPDINVIMLTSVDNQKIIDLAKSKGALDYVVKGTDAFSTLDAALKKHFTLKGK